MNRKIGFDLARVINIVSYGTRGDERRFNPELIDGF